ncbi:hypothetical protein [Paractinoplanes durhamensis]|uniref:hypothetical protein n=1 Tax=Paractinoplanes durhamensis TaxID=113563 RepID=UPI001944128C|nr:hypothetical protein [Actinoplanes durhamensis]
MILVGGGVIAVQAIGSAPDKPTTATSATGGGQPLDPEDQAWKIAQAQVDALLGDNEQAWLDLIDPSQPQYREQYRTLFRTLRAMRINHAEALAVPPPGEVGGTDFYVGFSYCFQGSPCPTAFNQPKMVKRVTLTTAGGRQVISVVDFNPTTIYNVKGAPWADDQLVITEGKRVVVAASASRAADIPQVIALADQAAVDIDRFGNHLRTAQDRYRIFLADDHDWATWFNGDQPEWAIGYAWEVAGTGMDVVLHASQVLDGTEDAQIVIRHEMGHVLTMIGAQPPDNPLEFLFNDRNQWLREGIAEYIGQNGRPAQQTYHRSTLQRAFRSSNPPRSIMASSVRAGSERNSVDGLYAMGYAATSCMAARYGEAAMFHFTDLVLREATKEDAASRKIYGKPFAQVDRDCLTWIRQHL